MFTPDSDSSFAVSADAFIERLSETILVLHKASQTAISKMYYFRKCSFSILNGKAVDGHVKKCLAKYPRVVDKLVSGNAEFRSVAPELLERLGHAYSALEDLAKFRAMLLSFVQSITVHVSTFNVNQCPGLSLFFLETVANYARCMLLLERIELRRSVIAIYNNAHYAMNSSNSPCFTLVVHMVDTFSAVAVYKMLGQELEPISGHLGTLLLSLVKEIQIRCCDPDNMYSSGMLNITSAHHQLAIPQVVGIPELNCIPNYKLCSWVYFVLYAHPRLLTCNAGLESLLIMILNDFRVFPIHKDELFNAHKEIVASMESCKINSKFIKSIQDSGASSGMNQFMHQQRRDYVKSVLAETVPLIADQPGLLGPKFLQITNLYSYCLSEMEYYLCSTSVMINNNYSGVTVVTSNTSIPLAMLNTNNMVGMGGTNGQVVSTSGTASNSMDFLLGNSYCFSLGVNNNSNNASNSTTAGSIPVLAGAEKFEEVGKKRKTVPAGGYIAGNMYVFDEVATEVPIDSTTTVPIMHYMVWLRSLIDQYMYIIDYYFAEFLSIHDFEGLKSHYKLAQLSADYEKNLLKNVNVNMAKLPKPQLSQKNQPKSNDEIMNLEAICMDLLRFQSFYCKKSSIHSSHVLSSDFCAFFNNFNFHAQFCKSPSLFVSKVFEFNSLVVHPSVLDHVFRSSLSNSSTVRFSLSTVKMFSYFNFNLSGYVYSPESQIYVERNSFVVQKFLTMFSRRFYKCFGSLMKQLLLESGRLDDREAALFWILNYVTSKNISVNAAGNSENTASSNSKTSLIKINEVYNDVMNILKNEITAPYTDSDVSCFYDMVYCLNKTGKIKLYGYTLTPALYVVPELEVGIINVLNMILNVNINDSNIDVNSSTGGGGIRKPSRVLCHINTIWEGITLLSSYTHMDYSFVLNSVILQHYVKTNAINVGAPAANTKNAESASLFALQPTFVEQYAQWYLEEMINKRLRSENILYSPLRNCFVARNTSTFKADDYTDYMEIRALIKILGPSGYAVFDDLINKHAVVMITEIHKLTNNSSAVTQSMKEAVVTGSKTGVVNVSGAINPVPAMAANTLTGGGATAAPEEYSNFTPYSDANASTGGGLLDDLFKKWKNADELLHWLIMLGAVLTLKRVMLDALESEIGASSPQLQSLLRLFQHTNAAPVKTDECPSHFSDFELYTSVGLLSNGGTGCYDSGLLREISNSPLFASGQRELWMKGFMNVVLMMFPLLATKETTEIVPILGASHNNAHLVMMATQTIIVSMLARYAKNGAECFSEPDLELKGYFRDCFNLLGIIMMRLYSGNLISVQVQGKTKESVMVLYHDFMEYSRRNNLPGVVDMALPYCLINHSYSIVFRKNRAPRKKKKN